MRYLSKLKGGWGGVCAQFLPVGSGQVILREEYVTSPFRVIYPLSVGDMSEC